MKFYIAEHHSPPSPYDSIRPVDVPDLASAKRLAVKGRRFTAANLSIQDAGRDLVSIKLDDGYWLDKQQE